MSSTKRVLALGLSLLVVLSIFGALQTGRRIRVPGPTLELGSHVHGAGLDHDHGRILMVTIRTRDERVAERVWDDLHPSTHEYVAAGDGEITQAKHDAWIVARRAQLSIDNRLTFGTVSPGSYPTHAGADQPAYPSLESVMTGDLQSYRRALRHVSEVAPATQPRIDTGGITGPSGGLSMTLTLVDEANPGDLTGGRVVAATGEISTSGWVLPIGGIREKVVAAARDGASVFFVPVVNATELGATPPGLSVVPVSTWTDALRWLCEHGATDLSCKSL